MSTLELEHIKHADLASGNNISLTSAGNVGIGTSSPSARFEVEDNGSATGNVIMKVTQDDQSSHYGMSVGNDSYSTVDSDGFVVYQMNNGHTYLYNGGVDEGPNIGMPVAGGITFGTDTAAANTLDDYEEGTWTATLTNVAGSVSNTSYTKIGRLVYVTGHLVCTATATGDVQINGLPYAQKPSSNGIGTCMNYLVNVAGGSTYNFSTYLTGSGLRFYRSEDNSAWLWAGASSLYSGAQILFNLTYQTT